MSEVEQCLRARACDVEEPTAALQLDMACTYVIQTYRSSSGSSARALGNTPSSTAHQISLKSREHDVNTHRQG